MAFTAGQRVMVTSTITPSHELIGMYGHVVAGRDDVPPGRWAGRTDLDVLVQLAGQLVVRPIWFSTSELEYLD